MKHYRKLPKTLKIGPLRFSVRIVKDLKNEKGHPLWGWFLPDQQEIHVTDSAATKEKLVTILLHECCHALYYTNGLAIKANEEQVATAFGFFVNALLTDNPKLMEFINA
jgi:hypothetical protein